MRVHPDFKRQGFGQRILEALEEGARGMGYQVIQLDTLVKQTAARHLYEKNGYQTLRKETLTIQGKPYDIIFYEKKLSHSL
jgi:ribosomal protein S18 acetylase RimI-like enzyme